MIECSFCLGESKKLGGISLDFLEFADKGREVSFNPLGFSESSVDEQYPLRDLGTFKKFS